VQHTFDSAELIIGEGGGRRRLPARDVTLEVTSAPPGFTPAPGVRSPFLNGQLRAGGTLFEECRPSSSQLGRGREAVLKLSAAGRWSLVSILLLDLGEIRSPAPGRRLYQWSFLVTGKPCDALHLFPGDAPAGELAIEDLLSLLGATADDVGRTAEGESVVYNAEGGFRVEPG
jgi:hypothetical protein